MKKSNGSDRPTALITGASGGFGYEFASIFAAHGYNCVIVARSKAKLETIADELRNKFGITVTVIQKDLSKDGAAEELYSQIRKKSIIVDVLVNNAGIGTYGPFHETDAGTEQELIMLNAVSLAHLTKRFLEDMTHRHIGKILNVSSMGAFQPGPYMANYCASKAYVLSLTEAISRELAGTGVTVSSLCPGVVITGFQDRAGNMDAKVNRGRHMDARTVAEIGYRGMMKGKVVIVPGLKTKIMVSLNRFFPRSIVRFISGKMIR